MLCKRNKLVLNEHVGTKKAENTLLIAYKTNRTIDKSSQIQTGFQPALAQE